MQSKGLNKNITFLLCVSEGDRTDYLVRCLDSIIKQTVFSEISILVVIDGFIEEPLRETINKYLSEISEHMSVINLKVNKGFAQALNQGLQNILTDYVARIDPDDIALEKRAEIQRDFLNSYLEYSVVGSDVELIDEHGLPSGVRFYPKSDQGLVNYSKIRSPLAHPSVMFRRKDVLSVGGYPNFRKAQDYALWGTLISAGYKLKNLPNILTQVYAGKDLIRRRGLYHLRFELNVIFYLYRLRFISFPVLLISCGSRLILRLSFEIFSILRK